MAVLSRGKAKALPSKMDKFSFKAVCPKKSINETFNVSKKVQH
jgi:hypothetical protein